MVGPIVGTLVYARDPAVLWWTCGVVGVTSAALALLAGRYPAPGPRGDVRVVDAPST
jgi:hypothetical protein